MSQFSKLTYTGPFSFTGGGTDPASHIPFTMTASGTLIATLSEAADGTLSGTWTYSGTYQGQVNGVTQQSGPITDSGTIGGTEGHLIFNDDKGYFANGGGTLSADDKSLALSADFTFTANNETATGTASGTATGNPGYRSTIDLASLDGSNGFKLPGVADYAYSGFSVASAGDVNGDGFADVIIGEKYTSHTYVVFGKASGFASSINLSTLNGTDGFRLNHTTYSGFGRPVASAGDVNGDGLADIITAAPEVTNRSGVASGVAYVVFGKASGFASSLNLSSVDGSNGFKISGIGAGDLTGKSIASAGDVNGDGLSDLIVGASNATPHGVSTGASYVVFGTASGFVPDLNLANLDGNNGFRISGVALNDYSGSSVASAGDVNGDGFADLVIGAWGADPYGANSGAAYVVFGRSTGFAPNIDLSSLNGTNGFKLSGPAAGDRTGLSVASAGDVNGDGFADVIVGAPNEDAHGADSGAAYVLFGKSSGFADNTDLLTLNSTTGFKISGAAAGSGAGFSVASAGDVNGDGFGDLIVGAPGGIYHSYSYVVFGKASGLANIDLSTLDGTNGFKLISAETSGSSGYSVASAGDVNGDGFSDLIVGAEGETTIGGLDNNGASYVVFGIAPDGPVTRVGTVASQTLAGGVFDDTLNGMGGNDKLYGNGGADTLTGGSGADHFVFTAITLSDANASVPVLDRITDFDQGNTGHFSGGEHDQIDVSALVQTALTGGQNVSALVRVVDDPSNARALLQVDSDGNANGIHWTTLAQLNGLHGADIVNAIVNSGAPAGVNLAVLTNAGHFGDFDGDGKADLVWRNDGGAVATWSMNGGTVGQSNFLTGVSSDWHIQGTGDFNGDGRADILWLNDNGTLIDWQSANSAQTAGVGTQPSNSLLAGIGDVDHDGKSDLIWRDVTSGAVTIKTMAGASNTIAIDNTWQIVGIGDYNGDTNADIMFRNASQGINAAWLMNGTSFGSAVFYPGVPNDWHVEGTGDFDGNGSADLFWHNDNGANAVWLMKNDGSILQAGFFDGVGPDWHVVGTGDFNGDHKDDVVWRGDDGSTAVWLMNGTQTPSASFPGGVPNDWATQAHHYDYV